MRELFALLFVIALVSFFILYTQFSDTYYYMASLHLGIFSVAMYFLYDKNWKTTFKDLGIPGNLKNNLKYTLIGIFGLFVTVFLLNIILYVLGIEDGNKVFDIVTSLPWYIVIFAIIAAPITEELFFRALLAGKFGVLISSIVFSVSHAAYGSIAQLLGAFFMGAVLAVIYKKSKSVVPCMLIHGFFNLISIIVMMMVAG